MPNINLVLSEDSKRIYVKSDSATMNTDYPVLEIYIDDTLTYTHVVGGSHTINTVDYTTTDGAADLDYASTVTTVGTEYIFEINSDNLGLTSGGDLDVLADGVWQVKLLEDAVTPTNIFVGATVIYQLMCCIAEKLNKVCDGTSTCDDSEVYEHVQKINSMALSSQYSASIGEYDNAQCKYNTASSLCDAGCDCGCS